VDVFCSIIGIVSCTEAVGVLAGLASKLNGHFPCAKNKEVDNRLKIRVVFFMANGILSKILSIKP
jgi:hypothetical protein